MPEAFRFADNMLTVCGRDYVRFMRRDTKRNDQPATTAQKRAMRVRGIKYHDEITNAEAKFALDQYEQKLWNVTG